MVLRLTEQIRNCILVHQQPDQRVARSGNLCAGRVWRAPYLNDNRVFLCPEEENCPAFTVDPAALPGWAPAPGWVHRR